MTDALPFSIGAWCSKPSATKVAVAKRLGITELHLMVHDDAADRRANAFVMDASVRESCRMIVDAGIDLHVTAWAQPHADYLRRACDELVQLTLLGAHSVCWDAEEPWTQAVGGLEPEAAAELIDLAGATEGVSGIGYASRELDPLLARADYVAPQAYVTAAPGGLEISGIPGVLKRWRERAPAAAMVPALAAYGQAPGGLVAAWRAAGSPPRVLLWSLRHIVDRPGQVGQLREAMVRTFGTAA